MHKIYCQLKNVKIFDSIFVLPQIPEEEFDKLYLTSLVDGDGFSTIFYYGDGEGNGCTYGYGNGGSGYGEIKTFDYNLTELTLDFSNA